MVLDTENMDKVMHFHSVQSLFYNKDGNKLTIPLAEFRDSHNGNLIRKEYRVAHEVGSFQKMWLCN